MKLKAKIVSGFSLLVFLVIVIGIIALVQFHLASDGFVEYRELARDSNLTSHFESNMLMVRMNAKEYMINGTDDVMKKYETYMEALNDNLEQAKTDIQNPIRVNIVKSISKNISEYKKYFQDEVRYLNEEDKLQYENLDIIGPQIEKALSNVLSWADENDDNNVSYHTALCIKHLLLVRLYVVKFTDNNKQSYIDRVNTEFKTFQECLYDVESTLSDPRQSNILKNVKELSENYIKKFNALIEVVFSANDIYENKLEVLGSEIAAEVNDLSSSVKTDQDILGPKLQKSNQQSTILIISILVITMIFGIVIAIFTITSVLSQLGSDPSVLVSISERISNGDLTAEEGDAIEGSQGVFHSMLMMKKRLSDIVSSVLTGAEQIATASEELSIGNQDLSNRTEQQATALEETSSAIEEMTASVKSNADNTSLADQLAKDAVMKAEEGTEAVKKMISSMNEINNSSNKIADIIEVINNIAFQTNLLALNASIEAARAGEQGKGFAVVAVEVRKLAKRSDKAAREIANIIKDSNKKVGDGVDVANVTGDTLGEINSVIKKVTSLVSEISTASQEQMASVEQIDKTLVSLDENTQKNAALVEESASATEELSAQAQELNTNMQFFKLKSDIKQEKNISKSVNKLDRPKKPSPSNKSKSNFNNDTDITSYETFSNLVDEGEFDEF